MDAPRRQVSVLMVDDEPKNLLALEVVLEGLGQRLVRAGSGKEALRCLMREDFAVILLDVQMPEMDGFETAALIRSRDKSRSTPIIFLTAVGTTEREIFRGYEVGAVDYILKPFAPEILRYKVSVLIDLHLKNEEVRQLNAELTAKAQELEAVNASLEKRVAERTLSLERSNAELEQFAAVASHDLQEPLRTIATYLQLLEQHSRDRLGEKEKEYLEVVLSSCRRLRQLINDTLSFSRAGSDGEPAQSVDSGKLVAGILAQMDVALKESRAEIRVLELPQVEAQPALLSQVFQNLISNAIKFRKEAPPKVELGAELRGEDWLFWVRDEGIGIQPQHLDKLFKLFKRLHSRDEFPGSGLGLCICKKIVERQGGRIWVESEPGKGSTFFFTLPKQAAARAAA